MDKSHAINRTMEKNKKDDVKRSSQSYTDVQLGVWRVLIAKSVVKLPGKDALSVLPLILVFVGDIYALAPGLVIFFLLTKIWSGVQSSLILRTSSHLLTIVSNLGKLDCLVLNLTTAFS